MSLQEPLFSLSPDGGVLHLSGGDLLMSNGLDTAATISLYGGNEEDDASQSANARQWWGNLIDNDPRFAVRSRTQFLTRALPLTTGNLEVIRQAVEADLQWLIDEQIADSAEIELSIVAPRRLEISGALVVSDVRYPFSTTVEFRGPAVAGNGQSSPHYYLILDGSGFLQQNGSLFLELS